MSTAVHDKVRVILNKYAGDVLARAAVLDDEVEETLFKAFSTVPRHLFVDERYMHEAYLDSALPLEFGQLLSRPSVVARMMSLIAPKKGQRIFEVGSGSGYTAALLATTGAQVYGMEEQGFLAQKTRKKLDALHFQNILIGHGDGMKGWKEHAPFDAICVWTPITKIEADLFMQLVSPGGKLVAAVGDDNSQVLHLWEAREGGIKMTKLERVELLAGASS